jgi:O-antigen ligase
VGVIGVFTAMLFGVLKLGFPIWSLTFIVAAVAYIFFTIHRPIVGLIAVICVFFIPIRLEIGVSLLQAVGAGTAALLLLWFLYERREIVFGKIQIPLLLLGLLIVTSLWFSLDPERTTFYFRRWVFNMMFVLLLMNLVTSFSVFKRVIWAVMIMAAANSAVGVFDYSAASEFNHRSMGLMENANSFGHLAALAFPLALYQFLYRKGAIRYAALTLAGLLLGGVVTSVSRGALLSVLFIVAVTLVRERRRATPLLVVIALALSATPLLPQYYQDRVGSLASDIKNSLAVGQDRGLTSRGYLNSAGLKIWWAHPVVGVGIGNFGHYYVQREFVGELQGSDATIAHNIYVQALAEMGVVGAAILLWLLFVSGRSIWRARRVCEPDSLEWVYFGSIEMMALAIFVSTASYGSLMNNDFWMFIGLTAVSARVALGARKRASVAAAEAAA